MSTSLRSILLNVHITRKDAVSLAEKAYPESMDEGRSEATGEIKEMLYSTFHVIADF